MHSLFPIVAAALASASLLAAQSGSFTTYGFGCGGIASTPCITANTTGSFACTTGASTNYALRINTGNASRFICGFELYCRRRSGSAVNMPISINFVSTSGAPGRAFRTSIMPVSTTLKWHRTNFPIALFAPNTTVFIVFDNKVDLYLPVMSKGAKQVHYTNGPPTWKGPVSELNWSYKILCCPAGAVPVISNTGVPTINAAFTVNLTSAPSNAKALFAAGVQKTDIDLTHIGAGGCSLYTQPLYALGLTTSAKGTSSVRLVIPNDNGLLNARFYVQYSVLAPTNPAGIIFTAGGEAKIGK